MRRLYVAAATLLLFTAAVLGTAFTIDPDASLPVHVKLSHRGPSRPQLSFTIPTSYLLGAPASGDVDGLGLWFTYPDLAGMRSQSGFASCTGDCNGRTSIYIENRVGDPNIDPTNFYKAFAASNLFTVAPESRLGFFDDAFTFSSKASTSSDPRVPPMRILPVVSFFLKKGQSGTLDDYIVRCSPVHKLIDIRTHSIPHCDAYYFSSTVPGLWVQTHFQRRLLTNWPKLHDDIDSLLLKFHDQ